MPLTPDQQSKLNAFLASIGSSPLPWYRNPTGDKPTGPGDATSEDEIKRYMAWGYRINYTRGVTEHDWNFYLSKVDEVWAATSPQAADAVVGGAGHFTMDVDALLILGGGTQGGGFAPLSIFAPWNSGFNLVQASNWLTALPGPAGPGV